MNESQATRAATGIGVATLAIGGPLAVAPAPAARIMGLSEAGVRAIGIADLALVPGLVAGKPRWPWMVGRALVNVAIVAYLLRNAGHGETTRLRALSAVLLGLTAGDVQVARTLASG